MSVSLATDVCVFVDMPFVAWPFISVSLERSWIWGQVVGCYYSPVHALVVIYRARWVRSNPPFARLFVFVEFCLLVQTKNVKEEGLCNKSILCPWSLSRCGRHSTVCLILIQKGFRCCSILLDVKPLLFAVQKERQRSGKKQTKKSHTRTHNKKHLDVGVFGVGV